MIYMYMQHLTYFSKNWACSDSDCACSWLSLTFIIDSTRSLLRFPTKSRNATTALSIEEAAASASYNNYLIIRYSSAILQFHMLLSVAQELLNPYFISCSIIKNGRNKTHN